MSSYNMQMQRIVREYRLSGRPWPASARTIAEYAITQKLWELPPAAAVNKCAEDLSRAMREEMITDSKGRRVRLKHPVKVTKDGEQTVLWDDMRTAPKTHMVLAFAQRRNQIVGDCRQLKADVDSYNESRGKADPIQMVFDFRNDLAELEAQAAA